MRIPRSLLAAVLVAVPLAFLWPGGVRTEPSGAQPAAAAKQQAPVVAFAVRHDTSPRLRDIKLPAPRAKAPKQVPVRVPPNLAERSKLVAKAPDLLAQPVLGPSAGPSPLLVIEGQSDDENAEYAGFRVVPPDTEGDVGPNHYVQFVNSVMSVYDTGTGERVFGPVAGNVFWEDFGGGACETHNDGDPIVMYDHLADRWILSQFALPEGAGYQCVAVSTTNDPAGAYYRYEFLVSGGMNDYPKLGVWPDGYYLSFNEFDPSFTGPFAVALERDQMLKGADARMVKMAPAAAEGEGFFNLQPADLDGPAPPRGTPNTFIMSFDDETWGTGKNSDGYRLWEFAVNWSDPDAATLTALPQVDTSEFDANLCGFSPCVTQPVGQRLDTLAQFTMYRAAYRHFDGYDTIVISHTTDATGKNLAGVRWAELRKAGAWFLQQEGTIAPDDGLHRWMSSAAMDAEGNIAIGYSVSSRKLFPSIRYAVHQAGDAPGTVGQEVTLHEGTGGQRSSYSRWGDYSTMSVAPDGCTFWYTQEYYETTGSFDFNTKIGAFKVPGCGQKR